MAWDDMAASTLNAAWSNVWPECVDSLAWKTDTVKASMDDFTAWGGYADASQAQKIVQASTLSGRTERISTNHASVAEKSKIEETKATESAIVSLAHRAGFQLVTTQDVRNWNETHDQDGDSGHSDIHGSSSLNHKLERSYTEEQEAEDEDVVRSLDSGTIRHALTSLEDVLAELEDSDPNMTRSCEARAWVERGVRVYRELLVSKKRKGSGAGLHSGRQKRQKQY